MKRYCVCQNFYVSCHISITEILSSCHVEPRYSSQSYSKQSERER